jgi:lysozyme
MYSSLASIIYNIGSGNFQRSTLRMKLNRGWYEAAADEFPKWRRAGGRILKGLVKRRAKERELFLAV